MKDKTLKLLERFCCCNCGNDFDKNSVEVMREDDNFVTYKISCQRCLNSFGIVFAGLENIKLKKLFRIK